MPYSDLPPQAFWRLCREAADFRLHDLYNPKFPLRPGMRIATAGSCFAQNIGRYVRASSMRLVDVEPAPKAMPGDVARRFGYGLFSARYGNVYTARQLRQLIEDGLAPRVHEAGIWHRDGRVFDALRPNTEPEGHDTETEMRAHRLDHLRRVRTILDGSDVLVFTLGLTEAWTDRAGGLVFPTAPGVVAGDFDAARHGFVNFGFAETLADTTEALRLARSVAPDLRVILTVSPVPLTATASGHHVLRATTYSKSVLRAVAEEVCMADPLTDYFPSYEIITGIPFGGRMYEDNLRTVRTDAVDTVMACFFGAHPDLGPLDRPVTTIAPATAGDGADDTICEEAMLDAFAPQ